jgi:hypothetical protein
MISGLALPGFECQGIGIWHRTDQGDLQVIRPNFLSFAAGRLAPESAARLAAVTAPPISSATDPGVMTRLPDLLLIDAAAPTIRSAPVAAPIACRRLRNAAAVWLHLPAAVAL